MERASSEHDWEVIATQDCMKEFAPDGPRLPPAYTSNRSLLLPTAPLTASLGDSEVPEDATIPETLRNSEILRIGVKEKREVDSSPTLSALEVQVLNLVRFQPFYLHLMVFRGELAQLRKLIAMSPLNLPTVMNAKDHRGNTALSLAVKLSHLSVNFYDIVRLLLAHGADPRIRDAYGWSPLDAAVSKGDRDLTGLLFDALYVEKMKKWEIAKEKAVNALAQLPDFYMELKWEFDSSVIPLVSKLAPHDTCRIWKMGSCIRLDMTLVGWKKLRSKRRNVSVVFQGLAERSFKDIVLINYSKNIKVYPLEPLDSQERDAVLSDILQAESVQGDLSLHQTKVSPVSGWTGKPVNTAVGKWRCSKLEVQLEAVVNYIKRGQSMLLVREKEYFSKMISYAIRPSLPSGTFAKCPYVPDREPVDYVDPAPTEKTEDSQYHNSRKGKLLVWVSREFPVALNDFLPVLEMLAPGNATIMKLHGFLTSEGFSRYMSRDMFPVKLEVPLNLTIKGLVTFTKMEVGPVDPAVMRIPSFREEPRRTAQKTLSCPRKRLMLANMAV